MKIRTLIVDDMKLAREGLVQSLVTDPEIEIIGEAANGQEAVEAITSFKPQLVFLDVQMPEMSGFEVIEALGAEHMPKVVFVTAYDEFALRAFDAGAIDYLLKPFDDERLMKTIRRIKRQIKEQGKENLEEQLMELLNRVKNNDQYAKRIPVKTAEHTTILLVEDIDWIGGAGNYLELHCGKEVYLIRDRLHQLEQKLDPHQFVRIHRSTIVNIDRIKAIHPMFNEDQIVVLQNGVKLNVSRTYYQRLITSLTKSL